MSDTEVDAVDLAVAAYLDDETWFLEDLSDQAVESVDSIVRELRRFPGDSGALALLSVDEDFVLLVRVDDGGDVGVLLSDVSAATDWSLAHSAVDRLGVHVEDDEEQVPAGDLGIFADLGLPAQDMGELLDDLDLSADELLSEVADRLGFGQTFDELAGLSNA